MQRDERVGFELANKNMYYTNIQAGLIIEYLPGKKQPKLTGFCVTTEHILVA